MFTFTIGNVIGDTGKELFEINRNFVPLIY